MANDFYTPTEAATVAAKLAGEDAVLSALVSRNYQDVLLGQGKGGAPIAVKMPTTLIARSRDLDDVTSSIILDEIAETTHTINLSRKHDYSAVGLSEADLSLNLTDFGSQVLAPQSAAIVDSLEHKVATAFDGLALTDIGVDFDPENPIAYLTKVRQFLRKRGLPAAGLQMIVGTNVYAAYLDANAITDVSASGSTAALREGGVGRVRGFDLVESTRIGDDEILAFHADAVTLVTRAPIVPQGASFGAAVSAGGFQMRYLRDYDAMKTQDRSIVSTFSGVGFLPVYKVERDYATRTVETTEIPNGGAIRLDTTAKTEDTPDSI